MPFAIGIDLGTTFSCVAVFRNGKAEVIPNKQGNRTTPSYVAFTDTERLIGDAAKDQVTINPHNTIYDSKRLIGRKYEDRSIENDRTLWPFKVVNDNGVPTIEVQYKGITKYLRAEEISAAILEELKVTAESFLGENVEKAVITVPAYFNDAQRQATKDAGKIAGLNVMRIINEPTAAALAYGFENLNCEDPKNILIFDLGGGTFDVTILTVDDGVFDVKSTNGNTHLGGEDFTNRIVKHFSEEILRKYGYDISENKKALGRLKNECERIKKALSTTTEEKVNLDYLIEDKNFFSKISRAKFEQLNTDLFEETLRPLQEALQDARLNKSDIEEVVLIGGSTRIPKVQKMLRDFFDGKTLNNQTHPDEAVALGAAIQAAKLSGDESEALQEVVLLDITPLSLGVEVVGGKMEVIVQRNTTIPCTASKSFTTFRDNQTTVEVVVYEGERPFVRDNNQLGKFMLNDIPPQPRQYPDIEVTFAVNVDGILEVTAVEKTGGQEKAIKIKNDKGTLTVNEIERMTKEAQMYREEDKKEKERIDAKLHLEELCLRLQSSLTYERHNSKLSDFEKRTLMDACKQALDWIKENENANKELIIGRTKLFEQQYQQILKDGS